MKKRKSHRSSPLLGDTHDHRKHEANEANNDHREQYTEEHIPHHLGAAEHLKKKVSYRGHFYSFISNLDTVSFPESFVFEPLDRHHKICGKSARRSPPTWEVFDTHCLCFATALNRWLRLSSRRRARRGLDQNDQSWVLDDSELAAVWSRAIGGAKIMASGAWSVSARRGDRWGILSRQDNALPRFGRRRVRRESAGRAACGTSPTRNPRPPRAMPQRCPVTTPSRPCDCREPDITGVTSLPVHAPRCMWSLMASREPRCPSWL